MRSEKIDHVAYGGLPGLKVTAPRDLAPIPGGHMIASH